MQRRFARAVRRSPSAESCADTIRNVHFRPWSSASVTRALRHSHGSERCWLRAFTGAVRERREQWVRAQKKLGGRRRKPRGCDVRSSSILRDAPQIQFLAHFLAVRPPPAHARPPQQRRAPTARALTAIPSIGDYLDVIRRGGHADYHALAPVVAPIAVRKAHVLVASLSVQVVQLSNLHKGHVDELGQEGPVLMFARLCRLEPDGKEALHFPPTPQDQNDRNHVDHDPSAVDQKPAGL
eukprot:2026725-Prymnesium_polylepis.1